MSKIKVNEEELNQFARIIGKVEHQCVEAIRHLNVDLTSLLSNIPGVSTRRIQDIEARYNQVIHKYWEKLDYVQQIVKKTEAGMKQAEKNLTMKAGEFGLELLGYYDAQRAFCEYDPITGEKVSIGERLLAFGMLALTLYPPAKVVGVGGKVAIKGINAGTKFGFASFAKNLPVFNSMQNVLNTRKVLEVFNGIYKKVVKAPLAATKFWLERSVKQIADFRISGIGPQLVTSIGAIPSKTVGEAFKETKDFFVKMASGEADNRSVWRETKGTGDTSNKANNIKEINEVYYGDHFAKGKRGRKELAPNVRYVTQDNYKYTTDELGRIVDVEADNLILQEADRNLGMQRAAGREHRLSDDDGGHLIGSQFHGSGDIDNLVAQNSQINRSGGQWYKMETEWANALKETPPRKVSVKVEPIYIGKSLRPDSFEIVYKIEGEGIFEKIIKNKSGG